MLPELPTATERELANPAPPGGRHAQIVKIACGLRSRGWQPEAIFHQIRPNYGADVPDSEIRRVILWSEKGLSPSTRRVSFLDSLPRSQKPKTLSPGDFVAAAERFSKGVHCEEADLWELSPCRLADDWRDDASLLFQHAFTHGESVNVVTEYCSEGEKARPLGFGTTMTREKWLQKLAKNPPPESKAGSWVRINPTDDTGIADKNITSFRFALLESDQLPQKLQLAVLVRLPLPVFTILTSGGKSLHAWIRVNAASAENYREMVKEVFDSLRPLGIDVSNRNPSRLSRLPGAQRVIGASGDGRQRILYLNPSANEWRAIL